MKIRIPVWWLIFTAILLFLYHFNAARDADYRIYAAQERGELVLSPFEKLHGYYGTSLLMGFESTLYFYAGTLLLLGLPTLLGICIYAAMKKFPQVGGLALGFCAFLLLQLGIEIWHTYPKPVVTEESRKAAEERWAKFIRPAEPEPEMPKKETRKYPRALPGGGLDWTGVEGGPR